MVPPSEVASNFQTAGTMDGSDIKLPRPKEKGSSGLALLMLVCLVLTSLCQGQSHTMGTSLQKITLFLTILLWGVVVLMLFQTSEDEENKRAENLAKALLSPGKTGLTQAWYDGAVKTLPHVGMALIAVVLALGLVLVVGSPGAWLSSIWLGLKNRFSERLLFVGGVFAVHFVTFWAVGLFFAVLDLTRPASMLPYKIQEDYVLTWESFWKSVRVALQNQVFSCVELYLVWLVYPTIAPHGFDDELPSLSLAIVQVIGSACYAEIVFYTVHRMLHHPWWWKHVHSIHHSWKAPTAISSIYAHPFEHVFGNFLTLLAGPFILGCHVSLFYFWAFAGTVSFTHGHCGWHLPFIYSGEAHDYHHSQGFENLGSFMGMLDSIFGTNSIWINTAWQKALEKTYTIPMYPVEKILLRNAAGPSAAREDYRVFHWDWPAVVNFFERAMLLVAPPSAELGTSNLETLRESQLVSAASTWSCSNCQHVYDPVEDGGGQAFENLPDTWKCPECASPKSSYKKSASTQAADEPSVPFESSKTHMQPECSIHASSSVDTVSGQEASPTQPSQDARDFPSSEDSQSSKTASLVSRPARRSDEESEQEWMLVHD